METNTMETLTIKKVGTREDVYKGIASRTAGGLTKNDIIEKNFNGKLIYISKKISDKMRAQMSALHSLANNSNTNHQTDNTITTQQIQEYNKHKKILKKNKKTLAALKINTMNTTNTTNTINNTNNLNNTNNKNLFNKHKSKTQKLSFQVTNNEVKNVYYPELKGLDLKELKADLLREEQEEDYPDLAEQNNDNNTNNRIKKPLEPFTIDELPDIDINFL